MECFGLIAPLTVGGPLAILAVLFPAVFGGLLILFRQWLAYFTVVSLNLTLWMLHDWLRADYFGAWWTTDNALWFVMFGVTSVGVVWAWSRHLKTELRPRATERIVLGLLSVVCLGVLWFGQPENSNRVNVGWDFVWAFAIGIWLAAAIRLLPFLIQLLLRLERRPNVEGVRFPTEGILLASMTLAMTAFTAVRPQLGAISTKGDLSADANVTAKLLDDANVIMRFPIPGGGAIGSSPVIDGDRIYVSVMFGQVRGGVFCFNWKTGEKIWEFNDQFQMKPVFSSPHLANGRIYVGEGLHHNKGCKLFCLDAKTGMNVWEPIHTRSHTESSPVVADGRLYFGAGDDGVYCANANTGEKIWQFQHPEFVHDGEKTVLHLHVDAEVAVAGDRVFGAAGWDADTQIGDPSIFCLDAKSNEKRGKLIWLRRTPKWMTRIGESNGETLHVPSWGTPVADGDQVFFAAGNARIGLDSFVFEPVGAVLGVDAKTGKDLWPPFRVDKAVVRGPVIDKFRVFFGGRDGYVYCIGRNDGKLRWKKAMDGALDAPLALDQERAGGHANSLFAISEYGLVTCFDPPTGKVHWRYGDLRGQEWSLSSKPVIVSERKKDGLHRRIFFGAALRGAQFGEWIHLQDVYNEK